MNMNYLHPADQLVMIMERIYQYGMTTTSGGNLSILDDNGDVWITPGGVDKGNLTRKDMVCIKKDGTFEGVHKPSSEYPFHLSVYKSRSDIKAVLHAHPPALVAFSIVRKIPNTSMLSNSYLACGKIALAEYGLPGSLELGEKIAKEFKAGCDIAMLENHGVVVSGKTLFDAFKSFEALDFCARLEIDASIIGTTRSLTPEQLDFAKNKEHPLLDEFTPKSHSSIEKGIRRDICEIAHRAYNQQLINSSQGSFSVRLDDDSFVITPYSKDRKYLEPEDMLVIKEGKKENGKTPSRSVMLHQAIYDKHPDVNSVIIAHPHNTMAFAVTDENLDSRTIPESYILLRDVQKLPHASYFMNPIETADVVGMNSPITIVDNDCVIAVGSSLLNAFDRLEVTEYSAKAIVATKYLGGIVKINDQQVEDLKKAFNLE